MKKTTLTTFNFSLVRIPLIFCTFLIIATVSTKLGFSVPVINLSHGAVSTILGSSAAVKGIYGGGIFPLVNVAPTATSSEKVSTPRESSPSSEVSLLPTPGIPGEVKISNSTDFKIDAESYLSGTPEFLSKNSSVLIVHTHTTESYTPSGKYNYTPTDTDRTRDKNYNMVRVGKEIAQILEKNGIKVQHDTTINDYPSYNGSYNRSSMNVQNALKNDSSIKIVLDVHRDAIEGPGGEKVKHTFTHDGKKGACVMFVVGSSLSGLSHDGWEKNMNFAVTLQQHIQSYYPGLMRPLNFRSQRFNQHLSPGAIIVEVGTNGNTLEEALYGAECFANALSDYITNYSK